MAKGDWGLYKRLLGFVAPYWWLLILSFLGFLAAAGAEGYFAKILGELIDTWEPEVTREGLAIPILMMIAALVRAFGTVFGESLISRASFNVVFDLRQKLFDQIVKLPSAYFDSNTHGHIVSRVTFTVAQLRDTGTDALKTLIQDGLKVCVYLGWMIWLNWEMTLLFVATAPLLALVVVFASNRFRRISKRIQNSMGDVTHVVSETVSGHRVVRTFGGEGYERKRFQRFNRVNRQQNLKMVVTKVASAQLNETLIAVALCGLIFLLSGASADVSSGEAVTFLTLAGMLGRPIRKLSEVNAKLQRGLAAAEDVFSQLDHHVETDRGERELKDVRGRIEFKGVDFEYEQGKQVLSGIDLVIEAGETVALVGRSGSGKSTLASLLPRFYDLQRGVIEIDGQDIRDVTLESLRRQIALVSQHVTLFNDTLRNNIAYGSLAEVTPQRLAQAVDQAHADEFIETLSQGLDTVVGDNGVLLSGGQRQRVAIARALLKDAPILILDEATSALDNESERHIQDALEAVMEGRTTLVIAHRLSTIEAADKIVVLDDGQIVESGNHESLLALGGLYAELHSGDFEDSERSRRKGRDRGRKPKNELPAPVGVTFEKSTLGLSEAWYRGAWWLNTLRPLSWIYDRGRKRRMKRLLEDQVPGRTTLPVIVVGNITVGGTGKTPLVAWLVDTLRQLGFRPGIVSRGYGGTLSKEGTLIPAAADAERYSDEGVALRDRLGCPIAICADRVKGLRMLETQDCDIAISDDGLQHYAMARDIEICVIDGARGVGNGRLLPAGPLREPVERLEHVDWVIANGEPSNLVANEMVMKMRPDVFVNVSDESQLSVDDFVESHPDVNAVCGIGNPQRFFNTLYDLGITARQHIYRDHHEFTGEEVSFDDGLPVVCTEKDAAKLKNLDLVFEDLWYLKVSVNLPDSAENRLIELLEDRAISPRREAAA